MRIIELDAGGWLTPRDFLDAVRRAIGAPEGQCSDIDAIVASIVRGGSVKPPYTIRVVGAANSEVKTEIEALAKALKDARLWRHNHRHDDVEVAIEIAS
jgi:hypothetical protein